MLTAFVSSLLSYLLVFIVFVLAIAAAIMIGIFFARILAANKAKKQGAENMEEVVEAEK